MIPISLFIQFFFMSSLTCYMSTKTPPEVINIWMWGYNMVMLCQMSSARFWISNFGRGKNPKLSPYFINNVFLIKVIHIIN